MDGGIFINESVSGDQREASITGLKSSTFYDIRIAAVNSVGTGAFTSIDFNASTSKSGVYTHTSFAGILPDSSYKGNK